MRIYYRCVCVVGSVFDGVPRNSKQIEAAGGAILGEAKKEGLFTTILLVPLCQNVTYLRQYSDIDVLSIVANKAKVLYGLLKEPDINIKLEDDDDETADDKPKVTNASQYIIYRLAKMTKLCL